MNLDRTHDFMLRFLTLQIDNDADASNAARSVALDAVQNNMGTGYDAETFHEMLLGRGERHLWEREVGSSVAALIGEWVAELKANAPATIEADMGMVSGGFVVDMLAELLDLSASAFQQMLGDHYMPEADDWPADDNDDE